MLGIACDTGGVPCCTQPWVVSLCLALFSLLKLLFPSTGEPVQIAMSLDIASISSISESDMVSERKLIL